MSRCQFLRVASMTTMLWLYPAVHAQQTDTTAAAGATAAATAAVSSDVNGLNRLIIRFRPDASASSGMRAQSTNADPARELQALGRTRRAPANSEQPVELRYHRSIAPRTHVALTSRRLTRVELSAYARELARDPQVASAEIDERVTAQLTPNDPDFAPRQWNLRSVASGAGAANFTAAWNLATGAGVIVAILDGGFRPHADLFANILAGYDFISADPDGSFTTANDGDGRDSDARDPGDWSAQGDCAVSNSSWHGTHVAGIVAALTNNNVGVAGAAYDAKLLPVRVLGACGGYVSDIAAGMRWAAGLPVPGIPANTQIAKVLNMSLGRPGNCSPTFQDAVTEVRAAGSIIVAAAGNDSAKAILQPANCVGVIAVTAHTIEGDNASYANIGVGTAISAPGGGNGARVLGSGAPIYSTSNTGTTTPEVDRIEAKRGTSMATAHVSAVAALMVQSKPAITPDELHSRLLNAARPHPGGTFCAGLFTCGAGLLDANTAVSDVVADNAPVVSARQTPTGVALHGATVQIIGSDYAGRFGLGIAAVSWTQIAGTAVVLSGANSRTASFEVPASGSSLVFRFRATDRNGQSAFVDLTVLSNNTAPQMAEVGNLVVVVGSSLTFTATASDAQGDAVSFYASTLPRGATFDGTSGSFVWERADPVGNYTIGITPTDGLLSGDTRYVNISVVAPGSGGGGGVSGPIELGVLALLLAFWWGQAAQRRRVGRSDRIDSNTRNTTR